MTVERLALLLHWIQISGVDEGNALRSWKCLGECERQGYLAQAIRELTGRKAA